MSTSLDAVWTVASLGLGGNMGDPPAAMAEALRQLEQRDDCKVIAVSRLYSTPPWGKTDQADFFNCCALVETSLSPEALLENCLSIEKGMKRERIERWGPRVIDIDVLTYGDVKQSSERLEIPHPRMTSRGFVMMPLADVAPDMTVNGKSVAAWLRDVDVTGIKVMEKDGDWWRRL